MRRQMGKGPRTKRNDTGKKGGTNGGAEVRNRGSSDRPTSKRNLKGPPWSQSEHMGERDLVRYLLTAKS
ncbi:hypothetical protein AMTR_s00248p00016950 [Amborella trichopoda]|uniref:Uncharacterized protein n=1 Tax=Amborella trichopoda TaxID=13333 RepID=W1NQY2_AMBTC|nr:hypothetical protein AMTR_s00248p00016950 [Amborella trichopoda]